MKKRAAEKREDNAKDSQTSGNETGNNKKLKLNVDLMAAMKTLTGQAVGDAESDNEDI